MMKRIIVIGAIVLVVCIGAWIVYAAPRRQSVVLSPISQIIERPLDTYTIDNLATRGGVSSQIVFDRAIATTSAFTVFSFHYRSDDKRVTGLAHLPTRPEPAEGFPVVVQFRGYVDRAIYQPGVGTKRSAEVFANNGFISLAPDFLGYGGPASTRGDSSTRGGSDNPSSDVFEERFQTYTAALDLLASIGSLPNADPTRVGIWGHSNGGQIALTVLEITRGSYPTTLWAPVTKPFPYSILYYTDEADDRGKALRKKLAEFEKNYDVDLYTLVNYVDRLRAPLQLHQGAADEAVPLKWNEEFVSELRRRNITIGYFVYPGSDHNLQPSWNTVIARDIEFFRTHLK